MTRIGGVREQRCGIRRQGYVCGKRRICTVAGNQVCDWLVGKNCIGAADRSLSVLERIPGKAETRLKVSRVCVVDRSNAVIDLYEGIDFRHIVDEAIEPFGWRHQPVVTETKLQRQIRPDLVVVLNEDSECALCDRSGNVRHTSARVA